MAIGDKLRIFALNKYGNLSNLADALGMASSNFSAYLSGKREPGAGILKKLKELGCDINWLLSDDEEGGTSPPIEDLEAELKRLKDIQDNLEEENRRLRESISRQLELLSQEIEREKKLKKFRK